VIEYITVTYPSGWQIIGRNNRNDAYKTALYRTHTSGGKGAIFTYDPLHYTEDFGNDLFKRVIGYITDEKVVEPINVPAGHVAFIIRGFDDETPSLTDSENSVKIKLWDLGYINKITYVSNTRLRVSDLSDAAFLISTEHPTVDKDYVDSLMIQEGSNVVLLHDAAKSLGGSWRHSTDEFWSSDRVYYRDLIVESRGAFLEDYIQGADIEVQESDNVYCISGDYPSGWQIIGRNNRNDAYKTALYRTHTSGGKGAIFTYDPKHYTDEGNTLFNDIINWAYPSGPVYVENDNEETIPTSFILYQNYPNPFNPVTVIRYGIPERSHVTLTIYNSLGQEVATLVNEEIDANFYEVTFDASNITSGVYFYRIQAGDFVDTKKMLLLR